MKKFSAALATGLAAMLLTGIVYFTIFYDVEFETIHIVTLIAILVSEGVTTAYAHCAKGNPRKVAAAFATGLMVPVSAILSWVYIANYPDSYATFIAWYCAGMVVVNLLAYILLRFNAQKTEENANFQNAKNNMLVLRKIVKCIMLDAAAQPYASQLKALEEKLHFSNDNVIATQDENIRNLLLQLQENIASPDYDVEQAIEKISKAIDMRNIITSKTV